MSTVQFGEGTVNEVDSVNLKGKTYYNFTLIDDDTLYRTGEDPADVERGDVIEFDYEENDYGIMVDVDSIEVVDHEDLPEPRRKKKKSSSRKKKKSSSRSSRKRSTTSRGKSPARGSSGGKMGKDDYWKNKENYDIERQRQISYQAAWNTAIAVLNAEIGLDLVKLGAANASKPKQLAAYEKLLEDKAEELWVKFNAAASRIPGKPETADDDGGDYDGDYDDDEDGEDLDD